MFLDSRVPCLFSVHGLQGSGFVGLRVFKNSGLGRSQPPRSVRRFGFRVYGLSFFIFRSRVGNL